MALTILGIGLVLLAANLFIAIFRRTRIPDVLLLIVLGLVLGPVGHEIVPEDFGKVGAAISTVALTVILFESGLSLRLEALRRAVGPTLLVTSLAFATTMAIVAAVCRQATGVSWALALATGATLGGTSSAVVIPLVKQLGLGVVAETTLVLESALTDVLCIVLAAAFLTAIVTGSTSPAGMVTRIVLSFAEALLIGGASALVLVLIVNTLQAMPNLMVSVVAFVLVTFGVSELLGASGAIAALALGFVMANRESLGVRGLPLLARSQALEDSPYALQFLHDLIFILKTFFFVFLGISIQFAGAAVAMWSAAAVLGFYAARIAVIRVCLPRPVPPRDASVAAIMGPKGLAAAVLAGVPLQLGIPGGDVTQQFVYMVVLVSILATSLAVPLLDRAPLGPLFGWIFGPPAVPPLAPAEDTESA
jgi:NhaP-type Na+/H+ or K+/H+ antiporter